MLAVASDGWYGHHIDAAQRLITALSRSGCAVLWLTSNPWDAPFNGVTVHQLADPTATATAIGRAATNALKAAVR